MHARGAMAYVQRTQVQLNHCSANTSVSHKTGYVILTQNESQTHHLASVRLNVCKRFRFALCICCILYKLIGFADDVRGFNRQYQIINNRKSLFHEFKNTIYGKCVRMRAL